MNSPDLRSFAFGVLALLGLWSAVALLVLRVHDPAVVTALAPVFADFFSAVVGLVGAVIVRNSEQGPA